MDIDRFQSFLDVVEPERGATVLSADPIPGGYSRDTVRAVVQWADGTREAFVLRGDPPEDMSVFRSDRDREWTLLQAIKDLDDFRIPRPRWYDATGEYLGTKCIVSEAIESTSMQKYLDGGPDFDQSREDFVTIIASAHATPLDKIDPRIERPESWRAHIDSVIAIYDRILENLGEPDPILAYTLKKIRMNIPPEVPLALVHGDLQPGNFLLSEGVEPHIIDWEFAKIGDPRLDLGYYLQIPMPPHLYYPDPEAFLALYRAEDGPHRGAGQPGHHGVLPAPRHDPPDGGHPARLRGRGGRPAPRSHGALPAPRCRPLPRLVPDHRTEAPLRIGGVTVITRPSTPRILEDVCEQLMRDVMPGITDPAAQIRLHMLIATLNSCANASAAEISLMKQEIALYGDFAQAVATATGDATVRARLDAVQPSESLLLTDVAAEYARAGYAFTAAMDLVMDRRDTELIEKGEALLKVRLDNERLVLSGSSTIGRSAS